jgi:Rab3 GTPase-activating protein catalytic subunit
VSHDPAAAAEWPEALREVMDSSRDFPPRAHHLARWYGLSQFVVICPTEGAESLHSQAQANLMLSSVSIAVTNTGCTTPVFVQLHQPWRLVYVGMCGSDRVRVDFTVTHLRHAPAHFNHLSGLLNIFKSKIGSVATMKMEPVQVAVRFLYVLRHWSLDDWPVEPLADVDQGFDGEYLGKLRVGAFTDPVKELHLSAIWPRLTEELVTDTGTFSDLNPNHASVWTVSLHLTENATCILAETLLNFYQLCFRNGSVADMLGKTSLWDEESSGQPLGIRLPGTLSVYFCSTYPLLNDVANYCRGPERD